MAVARIPTDPTTSARRSEYIAVALLAGVYSEALGMCTTHAEVINADLLAFLKS